MLRIGITGIDGLIGWHLRAFFYGQPNVQIVKSDRTTFTSKGKLINFVSSSDIIVHLAGMHCGDEKEIVKTNIALTDSLIAACEETNSKPHVIFASSTHIYRNTSYGDSKKVCTEKFQQWANKSGASFTNMVLPNIFGEGGKPFFNSAVSTFCYQVANNEEPKIIFDGKLDLIHAQTLAEEISTIIRSQRTGDVRPVGVQMMVSDLMKKVFNFADIYVKQHKIPDLSDKIDLELFNTFRSYLYPKRYPVKLAIHKDARGELFEVVKSHNMGQCFISITNPGITRGNHYHRKLVERFLVIKGKALIRIRKLFSNDIIGFEVDGKEPRYIDIPTLHTHSIENKGKDSLETLFWSNRIYDPSEPDTYVETV
jgi:UDP-2-acetamido-2,6-beta-L-arabino-hexul-4-ose reductase